MDTRTRSYTHMDACVLKSKCSQPNSPSHIVIFKIKIGQTSVFHFFRRGRKKKHVSRRAFTPSARRERAVETARRHSRNCIQFEPSITVQMWRTETSRGETVDMEGETAFFSPKYTLVSSSNRNYTYKKMIRGNPLTYSHFASCIIPSGV